jgi:transcription elongation factor S-II
MIVSNDEVFRQSVCEEILSTLGFNESKSQTIEQEIFRYAVEESNKSKKVFVQWTNSYFVQIYVDKLRSFFLNIKNNPSFYESILDETVDIPTAVWMTHQEINPERWKPLIDKKIAKDAADNNTEEASTDTFTCVKCKRKRCRYFLMQTRSADEPMTTFVNCLDCGMRWKC